MAEQKLTAGASQAGPVARLIDELACGEAARCARIRADIVAYGEEAVPLLTHALMTRPDLEKVEVARALGATARPSALRTLVKALGESDFSIRYAAMEGLDTAGLAALPELLHALVHHADSTYLRSGAHYVLHRIADRGYQDQLRRMLAALEGPAPEVETPIAAYDLLRELGYQK